MNLDNESHTVKLKNSDNIEVHGIINKLKLN